MASKPNKLTRGYSQYQSVPLPETWPLVTDQETRSPEAGFIEKDARLVNCYAEFNAKTQDWQVEKRPGIQAPLNYAAGGVGLGIYNWKTDIYSAFGTKLFKNAVAFATAINSGSRYTFQPSNPGAAAVLMTKNRSAGYYTDGAVLTQIVDADYPATTVPGIAYLDGTFYIMRTDGGVQGSAIDDPSSWDPLNLIIARNEPDAGVGLIKHQTYVVAIKEWSTQAFYNAGNATGSPLGRVDGFMEYYGCRNGDSIVEIDGIHLWVSSNRSGGCQLVKLEKLQLSVVSTPPVDRILTNFGSGLLAFGMKLGGHKFYVLLISSANFNLVYDIDQKLFYRWTDSTGLSYWPFGAATFTGFDIMLQRMDTNQTNLCDTDFTVPNDNGALIPVDIYTGNFDFGVDRRKTQNWMAFDADIVEGSFIDVRSTDDDYSTWSNFRRVDLGQNQPTLIGMGTFYQRAYHIRHRCNKPFRIKRLGMQLDIGTL